MMSAAGAKHPFHHAMVTGAVPPAAKTRAINAVAVASQHFVAMIAAGRRSVVAHRLVGTTCGPRVAMMLVQRPAPRIAMIAVVRAGGRRCVAMIVVR
jgi:hypothetical protein